MINIRLTQKLVNVTIIHPDNRNNHEETYMVPYDDVVWEVLGDDVMGVVTFDPLRIRDSLLNSLARII